MSLLAKLKLSIVALMALAILVLGGVLAYVTKPDATTAITSRAILERISDRYFVVTKSVIVDETTKITIDKGSAWSNFLWGQEVNAHGVIRVDVGVDLSYLTEDDIIIDKRNKTVAIAVPNAEILNASQYGDIEVESSQGVLKFLLDNDPNEDHNTALRQLIAEAKISVMSDERIFESARTDSTKLLNIVVESFGYTLRVPEE